MYKNNTPRIVLLFLIGLIGVETSPCLALQSGSRGAATSLGSGSRALAPSPSFSAPVQSFTPSQSYSVPQSFAVPDQSVLSPNFTAPVGSFDQNFQGSVQSESVDPMLHTTGQPSPMTTGSSTASSSLGIPSAELVDPIFGVSDPASQLVIDHSPWNSFLARYLTTDPQGLNRIHYGQVTCSDRQQLRCYLDQLQATDIRALNRNEQLAYWFNLYNARTVALVLEHYPIRSIRQIKQKLTDFVGPFDDPGAVSVLGKSLSLNDIESGIIRPVWNDPRIHYALNCASYGCPNIASTAWTGHDLDARLNGAAYEFINSGRAVRSSLLGPRVSKIYKWYKADFGDSDQAVLNHIRQYANSDTLNIIHCQQSIGGYYYDWSLNDGRISRPRLLESIRR